jgi:hypothetical protein
MKVCPQCDQVYTDEAQSFCLMDGAQLVAGESEPTIVMPSGGSIPTAVAATPQRTRSPFLWVVVAILVLVVGGAALGGLLFYFYRLGSESVKSDHAGTNSPLSSKTPSTRQPTPDMSASNAEPSPGADEVTPISWTTTATVFKQETGLTYKFQCPAEGTASAVWGSDVYTADSSVCTAAVHAGVITLEDGGEVTIEFRPGRPTYGSTTHNGITSNNYGEYPHSFVVLEDSAPAKN